MGKENGLQLCQQAPRSPCKLPGPRPVVPTLRRAPLPPEWDLGPHQKAHQPKARAQSLSHV